MQFDTVAKPVGQSPCRLDVRAGDARSYFIDCSPLLRQHELLVRVEQADAGPGLEVGERRARQGRLVEVHLTVGDLPSGTRQADRPLALRVKSTQGTMTVAITVRVHA